MREALVAHKVAFVQEWRVPGHRWHCDFMLPDLRVVIELDGAYWHARIVARDALKARSIQAEGLSLIRVAVTGYVARRTAAAFVSALLVDDAAIAGFQRPGFGPVEMFTAPDQEGVVRGSGHGAVA